MMKILMISMMVLTFCFSALAKPTDVVGNGAKIEVVQNKEKTKVQFRFIENKRVTYLGNGRFFDKETLRNLRSSESNDVVYAVFADAAVIAVLASAGWASGALLGYAVTSSSAPLAFFETGLLVGAASGGVIDYAVDALNPIEQYAQFKTLNDDVIEDRIVITNDIHSFVKRLNLLLAKL